MVPKENTSRLTIIAAIIVSMFITLKAVAQAPPAAKYDTANYPKDRKIINSISNIFDKSLSLNDNFIGIGADGKISYGTEAELKTFVKDRISFKSVSTVPGTELLRIFNGTTAIKTKVLEVVFGSPGGDVYFKVIRAETFVKEKGKWYYVLGQGTNFMTQKEFDEYRKNHTKTN